MSGMTNPANQVLGDFTVVGGDVLIDNNKAYRALETDGTNQSLLKISAGMRTNKYSPPVTADNKKCPMSPKKVILFTALMWIV